MVLGQTAVKGRRRSFNKYLENIDICLRGGETTHTPLYVTRSTGRRLWGHYHRSFWSSLSMWRSILCPPPRSGRLTFLVRLRHCVCFILKKQFSNSQLFKTILDPRGTAEKSTSPPPPPRSSGRSQNPPSPVVKVSVDTWLSSSQPARALSHLF